jgi:hypothetical protein
MRQVCCGAGGTRAVGWTGPVKHAPVRSDPDLSRAPWTSLTLPGCAGRAPPAGRSWCAALAVRNRAARHGQPGGAFSLAGACGRYSYGASCLTPGYRSAALLDGASRLHPVALTSRTQAVALAYPAVLLVLGVIAVLRAPEAAVPEVVVSLRSWLQV